MNDEEPLCKVFNINTPARIDLMPPAQEEPLAKSYAGEFDRLVDDLAGVVAAREAGEQRDRARFRAAVAASTARQQAEAQRNRRLHVQRQQHQHRRLSKAAPPAPATTPDWGRIAAQQAQLETAMRDTAARATQNTVRDRLAGLAQEAKLGRLDVHSAALLDVYRGRAAAMGLQP